MYGNYYNGMNYGGYPNPYTPAVPDGLAQLRAGQGQQAPTLPGMIWVLGESEARSYPVAPGGKVVLWDKDTPTIFIKAADGTGLPSFKILEYRERGELTAPAAQTAQSGDYITRKEFEEWAAKFTPGEVENGG